MSLSLSRPSLPNVANAEIGTSVFGRDSGFTRLLNY